MNDDYNVLKEARAFKTIENIYKTAKSNSVSGFVNSGFLIMVEIFCYLLSISLFVFAFYISNIAFVLVTRIGLIENTYSDIDELRSFLNTIWITMFFLATAPLIPAYLVNRLRKRLRQLNQVKLLAKNFLFD